MKTYKELWDSYLEAIRDFHTASVMELLSLHTEQLEYWRERADELSEVVKIREMRLAEANGCPGHECPGQPITSTHPPGLVCSKALSKSSIWRGERCLHCEAW